MKKLNGKTGEMTSQATMKTISNYAVTWKEMVPGLSPADAVTIVPTFVSMTPPKKPMQDKPYQITWSPTMESGVSSLKERDPGQQKNTAFSMMAISHQSLTRVKRRKLTIFLQEIRKVTGSVSRIKLRKVRGDGWTAPIMSKTIFGGTANRTIGATVKTVF